MGLRLSSEDFDWFLLIDWHLLFSFLSEFGFLDQPTPVWGATWPEPLSARLAFLAACSYHGNRLPARPVRIARRLAGGPKRMDVLSEVLKVVKLEGAIYYNGEFTAPWSFRSPPSSVLV